MFSDMAWVVNLAHCDYLDCLLERLISKSFYTWTPHGQNCFSGQKNVNKQDFFVFLHMKCVLTTGRDAH